MTEEQLESDRVVLLVDPYEGSLVDLGDKPPPPPEQQMNGD